MRILVLSDTHGNMVDTYFDKINEDGNFDMFIHCGDCCKDVSIIAEELKLNNYINVNGNCDRGLDANDIEQVVIENKKFLITHGHNFGVKRDLEELKRYAENQEVDVVVFGHTHKAYSKYENGILYFNPGSACNPTFGNYSYGVLTIENGNIYDEIIEW